MSAMTRDLGDSPISYQFHQVQISGKFFRLTADCRRMTAPYIIASHTDSQSGVALGV
jgi:hypothetical protein